MCPRSFVTCADRPRDTVCPKRASDSGSSSWWWTWWFSSRLASHSQSTWKALKKVCLFYLPTTKLQCLFFDSLLFLQRCSRKSGTSTGRPLWRSPPMKKALLQVPRPRSLARISLSLEFQVQVPWFRADVCPSTFHFVSNTGCHTTTPVSPTSSTRSRSVKQPLWVHDFFRLWNFQQFTNNYQVENWFWIIGGVYWMLKYLILITIIYYFIK